MTDKIVQIKEIDQNGTEQGNNFPLTLLTAVFDQTTNESLDTILGKKVDKTDVATINGNPILNGGQDIKIEGGGGNLEPYSIRIWNFAEQGDTVILETNTLTYVDGIMTSGGVFSNNNTSMTRAKFYVKVAAGTRFEFDTDSQVYGDFHEKVVVDDGCRSHIVFEKAHTILGEYFDGAIYVLHDVTGDEGRITMAEVESKGYITSNELSTVAKSGSYNDLVDKPIIPEAVVVDAELNPDSLNPVQNKIITEKLNTLKQEVDGKTTMVEVEGKGYQTSSDIDARGYDTITNVDEKLSKKADSTRVDSVSAAIPTATSQLTNDSGFAKMWFGTQEEYDTLQTKDATTVYNIVEK